MNMPSNIFANYQLDSGFGGTSSDRTKGLPTITMKRKSLLGMALYDFDTLSNDIAVRIQEPAVPVFHPVDPDYNVSLREILDISDDFLAEDTLLNATEIPDPVPFSNPSTALNNNFLRAPTCGPTLQQLEASITRNLHQDALALHLDYPAASNLKKRTREEFATQEDVSEEEQSDEHRFRPYQAGQWAQKFQELCQYKKEMGHCLVPHTFKENLALARWVKRQRYQYKLMKEGKVSTMTQERVKALEEVGFVWDSQGTIWEERLEELREFKRTYMHCNVPSNYQNKKLATWVKCQRRQYKLYIEDNRSNITPERIDQLEGLGFEWELRASARGSKKARHS
jgi:hypothetical protein